MARSGVAAVELLLAEGRPRARRGSESGDGGDGCGSEGRAANARLRFADAELIVLSPGVPADLVIFKEARRRGIRVIGDLELASWFLQGEIIGITGANGKTTTTALTGHILKQSGIPAQVGGNIGTPPAAMVKTSRAGQWNVLELSSFQLETTDTFRAHIGAALNVTPDHLDRHGTLERYADAKGRLFTEQTRDDFEVLNADDPICQGYAARGHGAVVWFSSTREVSPGAYLRSGDIVLNGTVSDDSFRSSLARCA